MTTPGVITDVTGSQSIEDFTDSLIGTLPPIYEKEKKDTILRKIYTSLAEQLVKADIMLESVGNNNYLSVQVTNEFQIRSSSSRDRLNNENAVELDRIRFNRSDSLIFQNTKLNQGSNQIQLFFVPEVLPDGSIDISVFDAGSQNTIPLNFSTTFDFDTNIVTIISPRSGPFTIGYRDTGDVIRLTENITIPIGLFRLGYGEGGFDELGFGE